MDLVQRKVNDLGTKVASFPHITIIGRALFTSSFFLSAWNEYVEVSSNWGAKEEYWKPSLGYSGDQIKNLMLVSIIVKILGGLVFIHGSFFGAFLLLVYQGIATMIRHDFYNHRFDTEEFGLLYLKFKTILNETVSYDTAYNLYKSDFDQQEIEKVTSKFRELADHAVRNPALLGHGDFVGGVLSFIKGLAIVGALLFYVTLKYKLDKAKKKLSKLKTE